MTSERNSCLVTGAAGGIGCALAEAFAEAGYLVIGLDVHAQPADLHCEEYVQADLSRFVEDGPYADEVITKIRSAIGSTSFHALINNAAVQILGSTDNLTRNDWRTTLNVNLQAPFFLVQALLPELEAGRGSVVNISSIHARLTKADFVAYATSKAALSGMTRAMAVDLGGRVRVNAIEPAAIETDMLRAGFNENKELYSRLEQCHPTGFIGGPNNVASLALWLCAIEASFVHGACLSVDGGISGCLQDPMSAPQSVNGKAR